jgi:hypothetical protein
LTQPLAALLAKGEIEPGATVRATLSSKNAAAKPESARRESNRLAFTVEPAENGT